MIGSRQKQQVLEGIILLIKMSANEKKMFLFQCGQSKYKYQTPHKNALKTHNNSHVFLWFPTLCFVYPCLSFHLYISLPWCCQFIYNLWFGMSLLYLLLLCFKPCHLLNLSIFDFSHYCTLKVALSYVLLNQRLIYKILTNTMTNTDHFWT